MAKVALVTGGTGSIGSDVCRLLVAEGWACVAADIEKPDAPIEGVTFQPLDVTDPESVAAAVEAACVLGEFAALVNAHGMLVETPFSDFDEAKLDRTLDVNLKGVARLCAAAAAKIVDGGAIVNLSSVTASMGRARNAFAYQATKGAVEAMTRSFAIELAPREIRVNCVQPGYLSQPMRGAGSELRARQGGNAALEKLTPFGRLVTPLEVAEAIVFLCGRRASGISGAVIPVDGGQRAY